MIATIYFPASQSVRPFLKPLPPRQQLVFDLLKARISTGNVPTMREIASEIGIRSVNGVLRHLLALRRKRLITWKSGKARSISILSTTADAA